MRPSSGISTRLVFWGLFVVTPPLCAQTEQVRTEQTIDSARQPDAAAARQLFEEARSLARMGQYAEACPKFEQSYRRDPGIGTLYNLADCWEHLGRTASAWAKFRDVVDEAARTHQREREQVALKRAEALVLQLSKVVVRVESRDEGLEILRDGVAMASSDYGRAIPLDPGDHWFEATAPGKRPWRASVKVPARGNAVEVVVPPLRNEGPAAPAVVTTPAATSSQPEQPGRAESLTSATRETPSARVVDRGQPDAKQKTLAFVVGGVGLAALAGGAYFGARVWAKNDRIDSICPDQEHQPCTDRDRVDYEKAREDARSARTLSIVSFGVGGASLITAAIFYYTSPTSRASAWQIAPMAAYGSLGAQLRGGF